MIAEAALTLSLGSSPNPLRLVRKEVSRHILLYVLRLRTRA